MESLLGTVRRADIIFRANGRFDLTARVVRTLGIKPGDVIDVLRDEREYYLYVSRHFDSPSSARYEGQVFPSKKGVALHFRGSSRRLCTAMLSAANAVNRVALPCGDVIVEPNGRRLLPIIVRLNLSRI